MHEHLLRIEQLGVVPAIILENVSHAEPLANALLDGGLPCAEVTLRTPAALEILKRMAAFAKEGLLVGAGTVLTPAQADEAIAAGAQFIVTPGIDAELVRHCQARQVLIIPGATTATEVMLAANLGLECVKFFPAEASGGIKMLKALHGPFPNMRFMPTGGITLETFPEYLPFKPVVGVGGTWMVKKEWISTERFDIIADACEATMLAVADARRGNRLSKTKSVGTAADWQE
ncbi:bifunctional 4-hydroxy-2-oxoglutarate aldolase/2-dehydro-3-deoxy-phosphogluconate aldolase [Roseimicrobium sp. ORNL1]|uniref:bifunctional 4-hydroxy-2-oxoglutarate aldolase/2-dehydro-3-deoxy-phosphogluconate aldolase n=1 Tax=Roseimicrobium sp. ORNL1 TaxID=2711231 RepID=UPI0013E1D0DD|nr:bifunctional 4-hydroxy-2-oxoglutarate aldolase/2-dehydro-3-deoxy-phosphogluconate aldolase [Roseimicrobium sp. ORNL1]QIF01340.1 bifunctional 4-hydroxy-2-oxoglutarate aldolase/2-dehydro-3-deoxy-phosphogluconate aldolase [Roseimicrobium sp. ORNL1]